jgi:hypothetical protein
LAEKEALISKRQLKKNKKAKVDADAAEKAGSPAVETVTE